MLYWCGIGVVPRRTQFSYDFRPLYLESKFEPLYYEYTQPKQTAGLIKKWAAGLKLGLVPHVTKENFHTLQRPIVMAYYNVDFKRDPKAGFQPIKLVQPIRGQYLEIS